MPLLPRLSSLWRNLFQRGRMEQGLAEEIRAHLEMLVELKVKEGLDPAAARRAALIELGGEEQVKESVREMRIGRHLETWWQDICYALRMLRHHPGFTLLAVIMLALGIGVNTAIFSLINTILLRPLPFPQPERIMTVWEEASADGVAKQSVAPGNYSDLKSRQNAFTQISALCRSEMNLTGADGPEKLEGAAVLDSAALDILSVKPVLGRLFLPAEYVHGANNAVLISHSFWQQHFGGSVDVIGKEMTLSAAAPFSHSSAGNGEKFLIVGVLPTNFQILNPTTAFLVPAGFNQKQMAYRYAHNLTVLARLKPGVTQVRAEAEIKTIMRQIARDHPVEAGKLSAFVQPLHEHLTGETRRPLMVLLVSASFVLMIDCANLANLLLARAATRRKEIALRIALGAGRARIVRQLLTESVLLAMGGGASGLLVAIWSFTVFRQLIPPGLAGALSLGLDGPMLYYTLGVSVLTGVLFGLAPAWQATRVDVNEALKQSGARPGTSTHRLQNVLVVGEVTLALTLLVGAGLLIQTFYRLRQTDPGFRVENLLTVQTKVSHSNYPDHLKRTVFYRQVLERVRALPGVVSASYTSMLPMAGEGGVYALTIEGRLAQPGVAMEAGHRQISPDYFTTLGIPLREGRPFDERDTLQTEPVAIINETMARRFFPGGSPVGKRFAIDEDGIPAAHPLMIIGVAGDVKHGGLEAEIRPGFYLPHAQVDYNVSSVPSYLVIRTTGDPMHQGMAVRSAIQAVDPNLPLADVRTMEARLDGMVAPRRLRMTLLTVYAVLALLLATVGVYGILVYFVTQHTSEIGIRMALGANPIDILRLVLYRGMGLVLSGIGLGLIISLMVMRLMKSLIFGVSTTDPLTFAGVALLLAGVALLACWLPARRATKVDPMIALRGE
jgi:putative ABC transport system permease protein